MTSASGLDSGGIAAIVDGWSGVTSLLPGRDGWVGFTSNSRTVYHRPDTRYRFGDRYVEVTTLDAAPAGPGRAPHVSEQILVRNLIDRHLDELFSNGWTYPVELSVDSDRIRIPVEGKAREFVAARTGQLWIAASQLARHVVTVLAFGVMIDDIRLSFADVQSLASDRSG